MLTVVSDFSWGKVDEEDEGGFGNFSFFFLPFRLCYEKVSGPDFEISITSKGLRASCFDSDLSPGCLPTPIKTSHLQDSGVLRYDVCALLSTGRRRR